MGNKLLIIGNGFDLQAGLDSSFEDFFNNSEIDKIEKWLNDLTGPNLTDISFISLLLYNSFYKKTYSYQDFENRIHAINYQKIYSECFRLRGKPVDWMDVEGFLNALLQSSNIDKLVNCFDCCSGGKYYNMTECICELDYLPLFIMQIVIPRRYSSADSFYDFFFQELRLFEKSFANYLEKELENHKEDYPINSREIIKNLVGDYTYSQGTILNFNYTQPGSDIYGFKEINIHGSLKSNNIIIGIDDKSDLEQNAIQFTKTFRKLIDSNKSVVLDKEVDEIIIYGHSLGEQDYSYFQSIFDYVNIYSSKTKVKFVYSDNFVKDDPLNPGYPKKKQETKMARKLFKLMKEYGNTLNNKDNGQNLIHKMILEGRLQIKLDNFEKENPNQPKNSERNA